MTTASQEKAILTIERHYDAPIEAVFDAFSNAEAMAAWWGPVEAKTTVVSFDFNPKGIFHYKMEMNGMEMYGRFVYGQIKKPFLIEFTNSFSDKTGGIVRAPFSTVWPLEIFNRLTLQEKNGKTLLTLEGYPLNTSEEENATFISAHENVQKGFAGTFNQLEQYLTAQFQLRIKLKTNQVARTSSYLNFPGNTEEAFNFYKSVFRTEFHGNGIQRFGDAPACDGQPPLSDAHKKLVLHVELPTVGGHIIMATDAPESMGFKLIQGNNMHINLEPDSREETKRLYDRLSDGGIVTMPLQDMFWGGYFGSCTDRFGINWMLNYTEIK